MKDIRINKKNIKSKHILLSFYKINFSFFSKILSKYGENQYVKSLISQSIPLTFLVDSDNNDTILRSISEIIDILKNRKEKEKKLENDETEKSAISKKVFNISKSNSNFNHFETINNFDSPSLTFHKSQNNEKVVQALESLVLNIKKNLKSKKNIYNNKTSENKTENNNIVENYQNIDLKNENVKSTVIENEKDAGKEQKNELKDKEVPKSKDDIHKNSKSEEIDKIYVKRIAKSFKKINEDIIQKKINSIKIQKINYDFISKDKKLEKNIFNKISKTISNIVTKNNKFKHFSEFSKNIISLNKKIKTKKAVVQLNKIIELNERIKHNNFLERSYDKHRNSFYFDNFQYYSTSSESSKILKSISLFHNLISRKKDRFIKTKKNINNNIFENKEIENRYLESSILSKINKRKKEKNTKLLKNEYLRNNVKSFFDKFNYYSESVNFDKIIKSTLSFSNLIFNKSSKILNFEKILDFTKNKKIQKKISELDILFNIKNDIREKNNKFVQNEYFRNNVKSFFDKFNYYSESVNFDKIIKSTLSFSSLIFDKSSKILNFEKILDFTKNKKYLSDLFLKSSDSYTYLKNKSSVFDFSNIISNITKISKKYFKFSKNEIEYNNIKTRKNILLNNKNGTFEEILSDNINNHLKKNIEFQSNYNINRNIVHKNKTDIKHIISNVLKKIYNEKSKRETIKNEKKTIYNEKLIKSREEPEKVNHKTMNAEFVKQEVEKIIKSYIESINFKKISQEAVENVESKIRFERYRNGVS